MIRLLRAAAPTKAPPYRVIASRRASRARSVAVPASPVAVLVALLARRVKRCRRTHLLCACSGKRKKWASPSLKKHFVFFVFTRVSLEKAPLGAANPKNGFRGRGSNDRWHRAMSAGCTHMTRERTWRGMRHLGRNACFIGIVVSLATGPRLVKLLSTAALRQQVLQSEHPIRRICTLHACRRT